MSFVAPSYLKHSLPHLIPANMRATNIFADHFPSLLGAIQVLDNAFSLEIWPPPTPS